jgi:protein-tyrosine phosphatase
VIDLHTHLLPGVDDGAQSPDQSAAVLRKFSSQGIETVACTPHLKASEFDDAPCAELDEMLADLRRHVPDGPQLVRGFEIMLDIPTPVFTDRCLNLAGTRYALVEFGRLVPAEASVGALRRIAEQGVVPLLAHPERYAACSVEVARAWRKAGAVLQVDATTITLESRRAVRARTLLESGLGDILASDNHGDGRTLAAAMDWLDRHGGESQGQLLCLDNPRAILEDRPLVPVPPLRVRKSWYSTLKGFVVGGGEA